MPFNLFLNFQGGQQAISQVNALQAGLSKATGATNAGRDALGRFTAGAKAAGAAGQKAGEDTAKGMEKAKAAAEGHGDSLTNLIHLAEAYVGIHVAESVVDGYIEIYNKTQSVSTSAENLNAVMNEQFRIAQETRSKWEDLAGTYQRISNAGRGLGLSQRQILDLTEELSMGMRLSGSSSREASMTMMELTHAFTVGTLTGREFRVMMKDAPALMHELQVVSGKTGAEFAEMGKHGKFTAQTLVEWFDKAKDTIADKFGKTIPTVSEGFTLIRNAAQKFFGETALGTGVAQKLGEAMRFLADNFETVGKVVLAVGEALLALFVIDKLVTKVQALTAAIAANPLGALLVVLTVGIALLRQFGDEMETTTRAGSGFVTIGDTMAVAWTEIKKLAGSVIETIGNAVDSWRRLFGDAVDTDGIEKSTMTVTDLINKMVTVGVGMLRFLGDTVVTIFGGIPASIGEVFVDMARAALKTVQDLVNGIIAGINKVIEAKNFVTGKDVQQENTVAFNQWKDRIKTEAIFRGKMPEDFGIATSYTQGYDSRPGHEGPIPSHRSTIQDTGLPFNQQVIDFAKSIGMPQPGAKSELIAPVDLSFTTALDGAAAAFDRKIKEDWQHDIVDGVARIEAESIKHAQERQFGRMMGAYSYKADGISSVGGKPDARLVDEKEAKKEESAFEKMRNQLRAVMEASNPLTDAQEKLAHAQEVVNKAVTAYNPKTHEQLLTTAQAAKVMENYRARLQDALIPFDAWLRKQDEATAALRDTSEEQERASKLLQFATEMRKATGNTGPSSAEITAATVRIAADQKRVEIMRAEQGVMQSIIGPQHTYQTQIEALGDLLERGRITSAQYSRAIDGVREAYLAADPTILTTQQRIEAAWLKAKSDAAAAGVAAETYAQIADRVRLGQLDAGPEGKTLPGALEADWIRAKQGAEEFGKVLADQLVGDVDKLNDGLVQMANGSAVAWDKMIDDMIAGLERLILKQLEVAAIQFAISAATGNPAAGQAAGSIAGGGGIPGISAPVTMPGQVGRELPGAYPRASTSGGSTTVIVPAPVVTLENHNHISPSVVHAAMDSREGRQITLNHVRAEGGAVASYSGTRR